MSWKLSDTLETAPVLEAVQEAVERFGIPAILNSDQGCQFTSAEYKALLQSLHIRQSMDGKTSLSKGGKDETDNMAFVHKHCELLFTERCAKA